MQYTSIFFIQLSNFSTLSSPLYIGKSNFTSNFNKGKLESVFSGFLLCDGDGDGDGGEDRDEGVLGGSPPPPYLN
jgi:hypothetical protein